MPYQSVWSPSQIAAQRLAKRRSTYHVSLNLWPSVGVMITLLIVFMTDIKPSHYHIWPVDLPRTLHPVPQPSAIREDSIRIFITREGNVFFRNYQIEPKDLPELIRDAVKNGSEKKAYVGVDRRAVYGDVKPVVEQIRASGVSDVCFLAVKSDLP